MPPGRKITKEDVINAAVELVRRRGTKAITARNIATELKCSTQPVFSQFATMDELYFEVIKKADAICFRYISQEIDRGKYPAYKASGMAYIRFAKEEKQLFKFLYMRDRTNENVTFDSQLDGKMETIVQNNTGLDKEAAKLFHLEMWAFVHGIASMFATDFVDFQIDLVSRMLTDIYQGLRKQYGMEG